ncbi:RsmD family RNA methyltransferase [Chryseobacterium taklimakanense]|uniref:class I SAM-dependent methyltransferase n=1 Tax=Chryseobacterium taklimakanense TaxID=536441 RepID=UPI001EF686E3|nr:class I SAM-dependent methyltransferase [Chryseobacterium taklimakanense]MCG7280644.1 RsmD family RNA methyltransferase [Chryseobacterium taklimakanense]
MGNILNKDIQDFINANLTADLHSLLLKKSPFPDVTMHEIVQQIKGRQVAAKKFPFLLREHIIFPPNLNLEQTSSQSTAEYKARSLRGNSFLDLTTGFGIDAYFLSQNFDDLTLVEQNSELIETVKHNWNILGRKATFFNQNLEDFLKENKKAFDVVYMDPARRDLNKNKVFLLEDLSPNLLEIQDELLKISSQTIIKLSPLIDSKYLISVLENISKIEIIAVKNEVKEVLIYMDSKQNSAKILCRCINLESGDSPFEFFFGDEESAAAIYSGPEKYLYIPGNAVLKSGAFNLISERFNIKKLHPNTHLYTSDEFVEDFPGRVLETEAVGPKSVKKGAQYNIISKNYPLKPEDIKKKYKLKDGGNQYLIFTQSQKGKIILKSK